MNRPVNEKEMTSAQKKKREEIVLSMKKDKEDMKKRYGDKWEDVMYATATKKAMKESKINENMDPKQLMGEIRRRAKGVELNKDAREHRIFAQEIESDLIDLFQYYQSKMDNKKAEAIRALIRKNKSAQREADSSNANGIAEVLWNLMNVSETKKAKPDFLDVDKDGNKKEPMKKALKDKKKKVTEGVLDSTDDDGWMAKSQLYKLAKYAAELHKMINDNDDLEPWVQAKLTSASEDISAVKHYIEYLRTGGEDIDGIVGNVDQQQAPSTALPAASMPTSKSMVVPERREPSIEDIIRPVSESKKKKSLKNPKDNPCWDGYEPVGTKKIKGKTVPNCVPKK